MDQDMTIALPKRTWIDRFLAVLGKRRGADLSGVKTAYDRFGPYVYIVPRRESFWNALFRRSQSKKMRHQ